MFHPCLYSTQELGLATSVLHLVQQEADVARQAQQQEQALRIAAEEQLEYAQLQVQQLTFELSEAQVCAWVGLGWAAARDGWVQTRA